MITAWEEINHSPEAIITVNNKMRIDMWTNMIGRSNLMVLDPTHKLQTWDDSNIVTIPVDIIVNLLDHQPTLAHMEEEMW